MKKFKKTLILASLVSLLPILWELLAGGGLTAYPLTLLAGFWFCAVLTLKDPKNYGQSEKALRVVLWILPVMSNVMWFIQNRLEEDPTFSVNTIFCLLFGLMFMAIGNYLPKVRMNSTMGIKIPWTYTSDANWNATHRFGGRLWFLCGLLLIPSAFLPLGWSIGAMMVLIFGACMVPLVYSWQFYRREKADGKALMPMLPTDSRFGKHSLVFLGAVVLFVLAMFFTGNIRFQFGEESFTIEASYHEDMTVAYEDIEDIVYLEENYPGYRVYGFGSLRLLMGTFQNGEQRYTRYTYYDPQSAVLLDLDGKLLVISGEDPRQTREIYQTLLDKCGK